MAAGRPAAAAQALLTIADAENPPLRVLFGTTAAQMAPTIYQQRLQEWEQWKPVSIEAHAR